MTDEKIKEECGLVNAGLNADGEQEWIGTDKEWRAYQNYKEVEALSEEVNL